jgi:hypothetical protein
MRHRSPLRNAVQIRVSDTTLDWLLAAADREKIPPSTLARKLLEQAAGCDLAGKGHEGEVSD